MDQAVTIIPRQKSVTVDMADRYGMEPAAFEATVRATCIKPDRDGRVATREEFAAFLLVAKQYNLNPLTKEIYAFMDKGAVVPIVGIDGWANLINSHPAFDGMQFVDTPDEQNGLASITCKMFRKDRSHPVEVTEYMEECKRDTVPWKKWPRRMLRHKATIQAARYAFGFAGIYDEDEGERIVESTTMRPIHTVKLPPAPPSAPPVVVGPPAPEAIPEPPQAQQKGFDFDAFRAALNAAKTEPEANVIYEQWVSGAALSEDDASECDAIMREACAPFWKGDETP